jgi:hypothetical protein
MKFLEFQAAISATVLLLSWPCEAKPSHQMSPLDILKKRHSHRRHLSKTSDTGLKKRATCEFPTDAGLVAVTPESENGGWAQAPDVPCSAGSYCPYACPPGQVMAQWNPEATSYTYPASLVCWYIRGMCQIADVDRTAVFTAIRTAKSANRSQTAHTVLMELGQSRSRTSVEALFHSARRSCLETSRW